MKVKEREAWEAKNIGKGGKRPSYDPYNKSFKGYERNPAAQEYASKGVQEYHHYSERAEAKSDVVDSKQNVQKKSSSNKTNILKNVIGRFVAVVASAAILVATYTTMTVVNSQNWIWSGDFSTVTVELVRSDGNILKELPAIISITQQDPTCIETGLKTYTATAEDEEGVTYTDTRYEVLAPLGHDHHLLEEQVENGKKIMIYECARCHETFTVTIGMEEND